MGWRSEGQRWRSAMAWLSSHVILSNFCLAVVPGFDGYLLGAVLVGVVALAILKSRSSRRALAMAFAFALATGFAARKLSYADHGFTNGLFLLTLLMFFVALFVSLFVYDEEMNAEASGQPSKG